MDKNERTKKMYEKMAESAIGDFEAGIADGWDGQLLTCYQIAKAIRELLEAGFIPANTAAGYTWKVPAEFGAPWLYSDRSCGHYSNNPWSAAWECWQSATRKAVTEKEHV